MSGQSAKHKPLVSVVIPAYNYERFLADAIRSVLEQTFTDYELIVVDDGSTDNTPEVAARFAGKIRYVRQPNSGLSATRNNGAALGTGDYIAFLDADDEWLPEKLAIQVPVLQNHPEVGLVTSLFTLMDAERRPMQGLKPAQAPGETFREIIQRGTAAPSSFMVRRSVFEALNGFDTALPTMEDFDFGLRLAARFGVSHLSQPLGRYRIHGPSLSQKVEKVYPCYIRIFERLLASRDPSIPTATVTERLAHYRYLWGRHQTLNGNTLEGRKLILRAIATWPFLGWSLDQRQPAWRKAMNGLKVYGVIAALYAAPSRIARARPS